MSLENDPFLNISHKVINPYITEWQENNKKVIGHYCTYIPEELLYAADLLPFRIRATGHEQTDLADIYMVRFTCSFVRATLDMALRGFYDFLDALLVCNSCDHSRRMFELFDLKVFKREGFTKQVKRFYISMPHVITNEGFEWYKNEIKKFNENLEKNFINRVITEKNLQASIEIHNLNREILRNIHELQILDIPKLNGTEALKLSIANASVPKDIANNELRRILNLLKEEEGINNDAKRIMLIGSEIDDITFTKLIEKSGAIIVSDFLCFGTRNFLDDVKIGNNLLDSIAERLYYRTSCPRMMDDHIRRLKFIKNEIKRAKVDGIILQRINNCDLSGCENMLLAHELKELDLPILNIDREFYQADKTRLQTRIEAFLEMIS
ncbi:MAG: 2-hydroxyacyl-CoA dehydratase subunit D [Candidatus Odinarchaeota archaeon]